MKIDNSDMKYYVSTEPASGVFAFGRYCSTTKVFTAESMPPSLPPRELPPPAGGFTQLSLF